LNNDTWIIQKIFLSIVKGNSNVTEIRLDTGLHRKTLSKYLPMLKDQKLIELKTKDWKRGKSMFYSITAKGINWLVSNPLNEILELFTEVIDKLSTPKFREVFNKAINEYRLSNTKIIRNYLVECFLKGDKLFTNPPTVDDTDFDQPFRDTLKKILMLRVYLTSDPYQTPDEINKWIEKNCILFWPNMIFAFGWHEGEFPNLEQAIYETEQYYKAKVRNLDAEDRSKGTHLLGLDFVDEETFEKYLKANSLSQRRKIMTEIEDKAGWNVHLYANDLYRGDSKELDKYIDRSSRPHLYQFIHLYYDLKGVSKYPKAYLNG
jgi:predicted transcriptional regulator